MNFIHTTTIQKTQIMLPIKLDPKNWDDFKFHNRNKMFFQKWIETNNLPLCIYCSGASGVGKTSLVRLFIKSLFCHARKAGESTICGKCPVCVGEPRILGPLHNIIWVQKGKEDTVNSQVNAAIEEAFQPPNGFQPEHRNHKVIVFDELQSIPKDKLQELLFFPELKELKERNKTIFIFITMNESSIDPIINKALKGRSKYIDFFPLPDKEIEDAILSKGFEFKPDELKLITLEAQGSLRNAYSIVENIYESKENISTLSIYDILGYASDKQRQRLWELIQKSIPTNPQSFRICKEFYTQLETTVSVDKLIRQLDNDLDFALMYKPTGDLLHARNIFYSYLNSSAPIRGWDCIKMLNGYNLVDPNMFDSKEYVTGLDKLCEMLK